MNSENKLVIEQINKYGKVPQRHELLQMIEQLQQEHQQLNENYNRIYNENCKLRKEHNITDISLLDENEKLQQEVINLAKEVGRWNSYYDDEFNENQKLKHNWNELKEWLEKELGDRINPNKDKWLTGVYDAYKETIDKMQKLEQDKSYIIEENIEQPYYEKIEQICRNIDGLETGCMYKNNYYIFHIPKGSIKYDYDLQ